MRNVLDDLIGFFSPAAGARREAWRQYLEDQRNYDAGNFDRLNAGWIAYNQSAEQTDRYSRDTVRARARDLERNSDMANSVIGAYKRNVVGLGWTLQARTGQEALNRKIEEAWAEWCRRKNCDVTETQSFHQMLRMAVKRKKVDGGILFKKCYTSGGLVPFKLQALEVDELDSGRASPKNPSCRVIGGIEFNTYNKAVGYWIQQYSVDGFSQMEPVYVPAKDIIYYFTKNRPSQVREMSDLCQSITRVRDANEFMTAVSVKERIAACLAVFIKKITPSFVGFGGGGGRMPAYDNRISGDYEGKKISPGMIKELNAGDEIQVVNPAGQATDAASYVKLQQRLIGAGQGLSYEATSRDMSQSNYSSARQGSIEDEQTYIEDVELLQEVVMDEVYETFLISGVLSGLFDIPGFWDDKRKYLKHEWVAAPKKWIDPLKEANATKIALQTGQKTFQQIAAENGKDWKDQIDETVAVLEYARKKGLELGGVIFGKSEEELLPAEKKQPEPQPAQTSGAPADEGTGDGNVQSGNEADANGDGQPESGNKKDPKENGESNQGV